MNNFRDIEQLSAYLDGELGKAESKKLETRLANDPQLASALSDLRSARGILRKLPKRKAPRNFTLTRQMVGLKPPLPRSYAFVRFSTAFATVLLVASFVFNQMTLRTQPGVAPLLNLPTPEFYGGYGGGGGDTESYEPAPQSGGGSDGEAQPGIGGGCQEPCGGAPVEAPAAEEAESAASDLAPEPTMSVALDQSQPADGGDTAQLATPTPETNTERVTVPSEGEVPSNKTGADEVTESSQQAPATNVSSFEFNWQFILFGIVALGLVIMFVMRQSASRKWR